PAEPAPARLPGWFRRYRRPAWAVLNTRSWQHRSQATGFQYAAWADSGWRRERPEGWLGLRGMVAGNPSAASATGPVPVDDLVPPGRNQRMRRIAHASIIAAFARCRVRRIPAMLFTSLHFIVFFLVVLALNHQLARWPTAQKLMLLAASYYFYGQWEWHYLLLIWFSTIVDYWIGRRLVLTANPRRLVAISVVVNLGFLAIFKYANWLIATLNGGADAFGADFHITPIDVLLPVG